MEYDYKIDKSLSPPSCLPYGLDIDRFLDITCVGDVWRKYLDPDSGKIHDGEFYYKKSIEIANQSVESDVATDAEKSQEPE